MISARPHHLPSPPAGIRPPGPPRMRGVMAVLIAGLLAAPASGAVKAFRITDMDLRDPHVYFDFLGCRDVTDTPLAGYSFNGGLQLRIQSDSEPDGLLDLSYLLVWDPLDPSAPGGSALFATGACTAPMAGTSCTSGPAWTPTLLATTQPPAGTCLAPLAGTLRPYTPTVISPSYPCFWSAPFERTFDFGNGLIFTLRAAQIGATFQGDPAVQLVNGLLRGFLRESDADATILPASMPLVGGQPLSILFPGGDPPGAAINCSSHSDLDTGPGGEPGWWMYFNFVAAEVPYTGPTAAVEQPASAVSRLDVIPNPAHAAAAIRFQAQRGGPLHVAVYDLNGRLVRELHDGAVEAGALELRWDGRARDGAPAPSGIYFVRAIGVGETMVRRFSFAR